jgi:hypothetical protein
MRPGQAREKRADADPREEPDDGEREVVRGLRVHAGEYETEEDAIHAVVRVSVGRLVLRTAAASGRHPGCARPAAG